MKFFWVRMRKKWLKIEFLSFRAQKWWFMVVGKIDDDGIFVNKKKWLGCIWFFVNFEINKKLNKNGNFVNNSKTQGQYENFIDEQ